MNEWKEVLDACEEVYDLLSDWERSFINKVRRNGRMTSRDKRHLSDIYVERVIEGVPSYR